jgi:hypothetical protein
MRSFLVRLLMVAAVTGAALAVPLAPKTAASTCGAKVGYWYVNTNHGTIKGYTVGYWCYNGPGYVPDVYAPANPYTMVTSLPSFFTGWSRYGSPSVSTYPSWLVMTASVQVYKTIGCYDNTKGTINIMGQLQYRPSSNWTKLIYPDDSHRGQCYFNVTGSGTSWSPV